MYSAAQKDPRGGHNRFQINQNFFQSWSSQMAYVLGFIFADGAIEDVQKSSRTCYISIITSKKDLNILEQIKTAMSSSHNLYKRRPRIEGFPGQKFYKSAERFVFRIGSKIIYNDLLSLGVTPRKSLTISFPNIPLEFLSHFIRGYFDGDGCLHLIKGKYPRLIFTSGSNKFLEGLSEALTFVLQIPKKATYSQLQESGNLCYHLHYNTKFSSKILEFMYKDLGKAPYLKRKFAIYQKYLQISN